jgi:hypothetical protein
MGGRTAREKAVLATEMLREITRDIADVSSASSALLLRELIKLYQKGVPKTSDVINSLEKFINTAMVERRLAEANMAAALLRRLQWLVIDEERSVVNLRGSEQVIIYDLSQLGSTYLKTMYALAILTRTYYEALGNGLTNRLTTLLVAEEGQNYVRARRFDEPATIGERLVNEMRSFGVGVVMVSPDPVQVPWHMARDVAAVVCFGVQAAPDFVGDALKMLPRPPRLGEAIIYHNGRIKTARPPKRPPKTLDLKTETREEPIEESAETEEVMTHTPKQEEDVQTTQAMVESSGALEEAQRGMVCN